MIHTLPGELLIQIARCLPYSSDRVHLASCCRRFREIILQEAYTSISVHYFCEKSLRRIVEILLDAPDLAKAVTSISLVKSKQPPCKSHPSTSHLPQRFNQPVSDLLQSLSPSDAELESWMAATIPGKGCTRLGQELWLSILLNCVPNIRTLQMEWGGYTEISGRLLERISLNNGFPRLTEATIQVPAGSEFEFHLYKLAPFFRLQSMRRFRGVLIGELIGRNEVRFANLIPIRSSSIEHIYLQETTSAVGFRPLIFACRNLKTFTLLARRRQMHLPGNYTMSFGCPTIEDCSEALSSAKNSLEHICIDRSFPEDACRLSWFGSLVEYTKLRTLHLRLRDLVYIDFENASKPHSYDLPTFVALSDMLPVCLEHLYVSDFDYPFVTGLRELEILARAKDRFPHLRVIDIEGTWYDDHPSKDIQNLANNLRRVCEDVGIEFNIRHYEIEVEPEAECVYS